MEACALSLGSSATTMAHEQAPHAGEAREGLPVPVLLERLSIDDLLKNWVGEFGRAQILHFTLTSLAWALEALHTLVTIFADRSPLWHCRPSIITLNHAAQANPSYGGNFTLNHNITHNYDASPPVCTPTSSICSMNPSLWEWVSKAESTVSQWDLVCESSYKQGLAQSTFFIGCLLGAGLFGHLSDSRLGRKGALALACFFNAVCGMLTAASPNYPIYALLRAATGICSGGLGLTSFVLGTESIGPTRRSSAAMSALYFYPLGMLLLSGLATMATSWRSLYVITSAPSVLYCLFILPFLAESPRWYLVRGRTHEALQVLKAIAKKNGTIVPEGISLSMEQEEVEDVQRPGDGLELRELQYSATNAKEVIKAASGNLVDVFKGTDTRIRMIILVVVWFASALGYYSLNLNVGNLGTNLNMSVVLNALAEVPGYAATAFLLNKTGRRITLIPAMLLSGLSCLMGAVVSYELTTHSTTISSRYTSSNAHWRSAHHATTKALNLSSSVQLVCGLIGLFAIAGTYNLLFLYTAELFPTVVRNAALGLANQAAAVGSIIAPIVVLSAHVNIALPFFIIGAASLIGGLMATKLPETLNRPFHETFEGMRRAKDQVY